VNRECRTSREFTIHCLPPLVGASVFLIVLAALRFELRSIDAAALWAEIVAVPRARLSSAAALTALNYLALTGYDFVAFAYVGRRLARWRVMLTSFLS
jgi:phosphatidylglycerol lysyltransferase